MPMTNYEAKAVGDGTLNKGSYPTETNLYAALYASNPTRAGTQSSELTQFARIQVTALFGAFDITTDPTKCIARNTAEVNFGPPVSDDLPAAYIGYLDASSGGSMRWFEAIPNPRPVVAGAAALKFKVGHLTIQMI